MQFEETKVEYLEVGDTVVIDNIYRVIEDLRENGRMNGVTLEFNDGTESRFYDYDEYLLVAVNLYDDEEDDDDEPFDFSNDAEALASAGHGTDEDYSDNF